MFGKQFLMKLQPWSHQGEAKKDIGWVCLFETNTEKLDLFAPIFCQTSFWPRDNRAWCERVATLLFSLKGFSAVFAAFCVHMHDLNVLTSSILTFPFSLPSRKSRVFPLQSPLCSVKGQIHLLLSSSVLFLTLVETTSSVKTSCSAEESLIAKCLLCS